MSEIKLLPCPFCGGEAEFFRVSTVLGDSVVVRCKECEARTNRILYDARKHPNDEEYVEAAKAWNTRKPIERIVEKLEEEKGDVEDYSTPEDRRLVRHWNNCIDICKEVVEAGGVDE